ncbi:DUF3099 domain-containing protein [Microbacterium candidum]|uniref:DUF3099 domain-containing protein n=1 Tax=Microbacterium candidum TaxID=3041922 RepID=A0ABT7MZK5_9MICO|nr:DUF3099 domain-containing protein [Microbacterium sp. ASV49]MDL9979880.1 DUF3099 domain-containing protein [Microbacterium sp. ASV49]
MKRSSSTPSATSLPRAPRDEVGARSVRYLVMMGVRVACFILMVVVQPYGWYTWIFGAAAIFLPYIAVVLANVGQEGKANPAENPERALPAAPDATQTDAEAAQHPVLRISETPQVDTAPPAKTDDASAPRGDSGAPGSSADGGTAR